MLGQDNGNYQNTQDNGYGQPQQNFEQPQQNYNQQPDYGQPQQNYGQNPDFNQYGAQPQNNYGQPNMYGGQQNYVPKKKSKAPIIIGIVLAVLIVLGLGCFGIIKLFGNIFNSIGDSVEDFSDDYTYEDDYDYEEDDTDVETTIDENDNNNVVSGKASKDIQEMVDQLTWNHDKLDIEFGDVTVDEYGETYKINTKLTNKSDVNMNVSFNYCVINNFAVGVSFNPYEDIEPNQTLEGTLNLDKSMVDFISNINDKTFEKFTQFEISLNAFDSEEYDTIVEQTTIGVKDATKSYKLTEKQLNKIGLQKVYTHKGTGNNFYIGAYTNDNVDDDIICILYTECADDLSGNLGGLYINEFSLQIDNTVSSDAIIATSSIGGVNNFEFDYISPDDFNMETLKDVEEITFSFEVEIEGEDDMEKVSNVTVEVGKTSVIKELMGY